MTVRSVGTEVTLAHITPTDLRTIQAMTAASEAQERASSIGLSQARLKELIEYNPDTGQFFDRATGRQIGSPDTKGYIVLCILGLR